MSCGEFKLEGPGLQWTCDWGRRIIVASLMNEV